MLKNIYDISDYQDNKLVIGFPMTSPPGKFVKIIVEPWRW